MVFFLAFSTFLFFFAQTNLVDIRYFETDGNCSQFFLGAGFLPVNARSAGVEVKEVGESNGEERFCVAVSQKFKSLRTCTLVRIFSVHNIIIMTSSDLIVLSHYPSLSLSHPLTLSLDMRASCGLSRSQNKGGSRFS